MRRGIKQGIAWMLSIVLLGSAAMQPPAVTIKAEDNTIARAASGSALTGGSIGGESNTADAEETSLEVQAEEYFDLGKVETSAIPMSFFGLADGSVSLINGTATKWIDRLDLTGDAAVMKDFYNTLVEASDNDGTADYLIEDKYFDGDHSIVVAEITGKLTGPYSTQEELSAAVKAVAEPAFASYAKYIRAAYDAFDRDHPEVFWLDGSTQSGYSSSASGNSVDGYDYTITISFIVQDSANAIDIRAIGYQSESDIKTAITAVESRVSDLVSAVSSETVEKQLAYFNEQLTKTNEYNTSQDLDAIGHDCRECTAALAGRTGEKGPVCESYARAFKVLCDEAGIPCVLVDGQAKNSADSMGEAHMWNYVRTAGKWLAVDVTWNDPMGGASGAESGVENAEWLLVYADSEISGMTFIDSHPVSNQASENGVGFTNGPTLALSSDVAEKGKVATEEEFKAALADDSIDVIELTGEITLSKSAFSTDDAFVIDREVTITGNGVGGLRLECSGIILGADVTFENMTFHVISPVRNAIIINGYGLTIENVSLVENAYVDTYTLDIFCGAITDYTGSNLLPTADDTFSQLLIKGTNTIGGNIFAGSLSDVGDGEADQENEYYGSVLIELEQDASGFSNIYAHGARENRSGGHYNEWLPSADLYRVYGRVDISSASNKPVTIEGATGGSENAMFIYEGDGSGNVYKPILNNMGSLELISLSSNVTHLEPIISQTDFPLLAVTQNTRLSFVNMGQEISATHLTGGGELVFKDTSQKLTLGKANGTTKIAVGGVDAAGTGSTGIISPGWNCITVEDTSDGGTFTLMPNSSQSNVILEEENGSWTTKIEESTARIQEITVEDMFAEKEGVEAVYIPVTVLYDTESDANFLGNIPMIVTINGEETLSEWGVFGYEYSTGNTNSDIIMWVEPGDNANEEILYIVNCDETASVPVGTYTFSLTIPASYTVSGQEKVISFVLTVEEEPTGTPTATPTVVPSPTATVTPEPTSKPTATPTAAPSPTATVTPEPTSKPTATPTAVPSPTATVTPEPTSKPTATPTAAPSPTATVTAKPTSKPTATPTAAPSPTAMVTAKPTSKPTATPSPTATVTAKPTSKPTAAPTATVTPKPTVRPTVAPRPTAAPVPTYAPVVIPTATPLPTATPTPKNPDIVTEQDIYTEKEQEKLAELKLPEETVKVQEAVEKVVQSVTKLFLNKVSEEVKEKLEEHIILAKTPTTENNLAAVLNNNSVDLMLKSLTFREQNRIADGELVKMYIEVKDATETVSKLEKTLVKDLQKDINAILNEGKTGMIQRKSELGMYLTMNLMKQISNEEAQVVKRPSGMVEVSLQIPEDLLSKDAKVQRMYQIISIDQDKCVLLDAEFNVKTNMLSFKTNKFTTFALIYMDVPVEKK